MAIQRDTWRALTGLILLTLLTADHARATADRARTGAAFHASSSLADSLFQTHPGSRFDSHASLTTTKEGSRFDSHAGGLINTEGSRFDSHAGLINTEEGGSGFDSHAGLINTEEGGSGFDSHAGFGADDVLPDFPADLLLSEDPGGFSEGAGHRLAPLRAVHASLSGISDIFASYGASDVLSGWDEEGGEADVLVAAEGVREGLGEGAFDGEIGAERAGPHARAVPAIPEGLITGGPLDFGRSPLRFDGDLFLEYFGSTEVAAEDRERLEKLQRDAEREVEAGEPSDDDRREAAGALSEESIENILRYTEEKQQDTIDELYKEAKVGKYFGLPLFGVYETGSYKWTAKFDGVWRWSDSPSRLPKDDEWRDIRDPRFPHGDREMSELRAKVLTPEFVRIAAYLSREMDHSTTLKDSYGIVKDKYDEIKEEHGSSSSGSGSGSDSGSGSGSDWVMTRRGKRYTGGSGSGSGDGDGDGDGSERATIKENVRGIEVEYKAGDNFLLALVKAIFLGFLNGASFGLVSGFGDAINHETCAPHRAKVKLAFKRLTVASGKFFRGLFSSEARGGKTRTELFKAMMTAIVCFFKSVVLFVWRCKPLFVMIGMLVAVIGLALVINLALVATGYGLIVKIVEFIMTIWSIWSVFKKNFKILASNVKTCFRAGRCSRGQVLTIVRAITEIGGLLVGSVYLGGINKIVKVTNVKAAMKSKNLRLVGFKLDPQLSMYVAQFGQKIKNAKTLITATGTAIKTRSKHPLTGARIQVAQSKLNPKADQMFASARSLVDDAKENVRIVRETARSMDKKIAAINKQIAGMADDAPELSILVQRRNAMINAAETTRYRASGAEAALRATRGNLDDFVKKYAGTFNGKRPSIKLMDEVVGKYRQIYQHKKRLEFASSSLFAEQHRLRRINMMIREAGEGSAKAADLAVEAAQVSKVVARRARNVKADLERYLSVAQSSFDDADDVTAAMAKSNMLSAVSSEAGKVDSFTAMAFDESTAALKYIRQSSKVTAKAKEEALIAQNALGVASTHMRSTSSRLATELHNLRGAYEIIMQNTRMAANAARGSVIHAIAQREDAERAKEAAEASKDARKRAERILDDLKIEDKLRDMLQERFHLTATVKYGVNVEGARDTDGFFVVAEFAHSDGQRDLQREVSPAGEGTSPIFAEKELNFKAFELKDRRIRFYLFQRLDDTGTDLSRQESTGDHLIGVSALTSLDSITDRGETIEFVLPVMKLKPVDEVAPKPATTPEDLEKVYSVLAGGAAPDATAAALLESLSTPRTSQTGGPDAETEAGTEAENEAEAENETGAGTDDMSGSEEKLPWEEGGNDDARGDGAATAGADVELSHKPRNPPHRSVDSHDGPGPVPSSSDGYGNTGWPYLRNIFKSDATQESEDEEAIPEMIYDGSLVVDISIELKGAPTPAKQSFSIPGEAPPLTSEAETFAEALATAMDGWGTYDDDLINAISAIRPREMSAVRKAFRERYDGSLVNAIQEDTSGDYRTLLVKLVTRSRVTSGTRDLTTSILGGATSLRSAMNRWGTDEDELIRVFSYADTQYLQDVAKKYKSMYRRDLLSDVRSETSGHFQHLLTKLLKPSYQRPCKDV